ncbi:MAG: 50S ribosomal protein L11 methyltransferase [Chloroflexota bacterium]
MSPDPTTPSTWLEVSLLVNGEIAESTAEVLSRFTTNGVVIESTGVSVTPNGEGFPVGLLRVCAYLDMDETLEEKRHSLEEALWHLGTIHPLPSPDYKVIRAANWMETWRQHFQPIPIGRRLLILPSWVEVTETERVLIRIDPGLAFGTGVHPSTQICLQVIEERVQGGETVMDIGCGSGILSVAALKLGARKALGVDVDAQAVEAARATAEANGVSQRFHAHQGSVADIRAGCFPMRRASLVLANILASVLIRLLDEGLADLLTSDGFLVLSGILEEQEAGVLAALARHNLVTSQRHQIEDWVAYVCQRGSISGGYSE